VTAELEEVVVASDVLDPEQFLPLPRQYVFGLTSGRLIGRPGIGIAVRLRQRGFGLDTELAAAVLASGARPFEVPIAYYGRTHDEGKKITWRDGVHCLWILARSRVRRRIATVAPPREWAKGPTVELYGRPGLRGGGRPQPPASRNGRTNVALEAERE